MAEAAGYCLQGLVLQCCAKRHSIPLFLVMQWGKVCVTKSIMGDNYGIYNGVWQKQSDDNCNDSHCSHCMKVLAGGTGLIVHVSYHLSQYDVIIQGKTLASGLPAHDMQLTCTRKSL